MNLRWAGSGPEADRRGASQRSEEDGGAAFTVPIGVALDQMLRQRGLEDALVFGRVISCWETVVGPEIAWQVRPQLVRGRELIVSVDHPAWATELELAGSAILSRLAEELGEVAPQRLSVRVEPGSRR